MAITVGTGGFERRFAYTLPAFTGTHDAVFTFRQWDFPAAAVDGGSDSFLNGGGDFRACLNDDGTNELPTHVVRFVTGGAPDVEVKVYVTGAVTGKTIYFFGKKAGSVAYAVDDPFGRNNTYHDYEFFIPMRESVLPFTDVTGNGHDATLTSGASLPVVSADHPFGGTWPDFQSDQYLTLASSQHSLDGGNLSLGAIVSLDESSDSEGLIGNWGDISSNYAQVQSSGRFIPKGTIGQDIASPSSPTPLGGAYKIDASYTSAASKTYRDGVLLGQDTDVRWTTGIVGSADFVIGAYYLSTNVYSLNGRVCDVYGAKYEKSSDLLALEYANQFNTGSSWGTVGALEDITGGAPAGDSVPLSLLTNTQTFYPLSASASAEITLPALLNTQSFYPLVASAQATSALPFLTNEQTFPALTISVGNVSVALPFLQNNQSFYPLTVAGGGSAVNLPVLINTQTFYPLGVDAGPVSVGIPFLSNNQTFYPLTVLSGAAVDLPLLVNNRTFYPLSVSAEAAITLPSLVNTQEFYPLSIVSGSSVDLPLLVNEQAFYPLGVEIGSVSVALAFLENTPTFYPLTASDNAVVSGGTFTAQDRADLQLIRKLLTNKADVVGELCTVYDDDGLTPLIQFTVTNNGNLRTPQ